MYESELKVSDIIAPVYYNKPLDWDMLTCLHSLEEISKCKTKSGKTALTYAVEHSPEHVVTGLINLGVNPNVIDFSGDYPLHILVKYRQRERQNNCALLKKLINTGAYMNCQDRNGNTPLMIALEEGKVDLAEMLINSGADLYVKNYLGVAVKEKDGTPKIKTQKKHTIESIVVCWNRMIKRSRQKQ